MENSAIRKGFRANRPRGAAQSLPLARCQDDEVTANGQAAHGQMQNGAGPARGLAVGNYDDEICVAVWPSRARGPRAKQANFKDIGPHRQDAAEDLGLQRVVRHGAPQVRRVGVWQAASVAAKHARGNGDAPDRGVAQACSQRTTWGCGTADQSTSSKASAVPAGMTTFLG